jgi:hypothetical protein
MHRGKLCIRLGIIVACVIHVGTLLSQKIGIVIKKSYKSTDGLRMIQYARYSQRGSVVSLVLAQKYWQERFETITCIEYTVLPKKGNIDDLDSCVYLPRRKLSSAMFDDLQEIHAAQQDLLAIIAHSPQA